MNQNSKLLPAVVIVGIFALAFISIGYLIKSSISDEPAISIGSVEDTNEYTATTTAKITGTLVKVAETNHLIASSTGGWTLGSVIIASTTDATMSIYDATSSAAVADGTYPTLITTFPSLAPQGTYTYDVRLKNGLAIQLEAGFAGDYVITHRR